MIDLARLRCFHAVARHVSITKASAELHLTPSAVSQQLSKLEEELGHLLIERDGRGIRLTPAAQVLAEHATVVLSQLERAKAELEAAGTAIGGHLKLAAFPTSARGIAPRAIAAVQRAHPQLRVTLHEREPSDALAMLSHGDLDVVIVQDWFNSPLVLPEGLSRRGLFDDRVDLAVPSDHRLADRQSVELSEVVNERWISWEPGSVCADWLVLTLRLSGLEPVIAHTASEHPTQLALVQAGLGVAVVPRLGRGETPSGVRMVEVRPTLSRHIYAVWRSDAARRPSIQVLVDALHSEGQRFSQASRPDERPRKARARG